MGQYIRYIPNDDSENIRLSYSCTFVLSSYGRITFMVSSPARRFECEKKRKEFQQGKRNYIPVYNYLKFKYIMDFIS
jgi:hypothetical protein